ncbi:MAG TPA: hypothetical protein VNF47_15675 [Streptosporangiaceae bacterium]|nr:hypothetical protein [Streptosporangiaceae bacterium]
MRKISLLLTAVGGAALIGVTAIQGVAASAEPRPGPATMLKFDTMTPVTGPYVGAANPLRGIPGGSLPWMLMAGRGSLKRDGHLLVKVRGLVLADQPSVPAQLRGKNPFPDFRAMVSCQTIGAGDTAAVTNISTGNFKASPTGNSNINARVMLPHPCIAPIVFVTGPTGVEIWFAVTGG